ncbi:MAG TPA: hypothetical protein VFV02_17045, partial [Acidimicrobiales bacterium]|nr:hypothetical protein [Acidimicrobiales bacterium]
MRNQNGSSVDPKKVLESVFRRHDGWAAEIVQKVAGTTPAAEKSGVDRSVIGRAIEYAIGLDLAQDAYADQRSVLPPAHAEWIAAQLDERRKNQSADSVAYPVGLLQSAYYLARCHSLLHYGTERQVDPEVARMILANQFDSPACDRLSPAVESELAQLWELYASNVRGLIAARTPVRAAPVLGRGKGPDGPYPQAIADFIAADMLVEVKTIRVYEGGWWSSDAAVQIMRYALLAPAFGYPVVEVALYLARYGMLLTWELAELAARLA